MLLPSRTTIPFLTILTGGNITVPSTSFLGLASAAGRIVFTDAATDTVQILDADVRIGASAQARKFSVRGDASNVVGAFEHNGSIGVPTLIISREPENLTVANTLMGTFTFVGSRSNGQNLGAEISSVAEAPSTDRTSALIFVTGNANDIRTEKVRVSSGGNLGVATPTPQTKLHVSETGTAETRGILSAQYNSDTHGGRFVGRKARGTEATPTVIATGDVLQSLTAEGYDGSNYLMMGAIDIMSTGTIASTRVPTRMLFKTATDALPSVITTRLAIEANGNVTPGVDNAQSLGTAGLRWSDLRSVLINGADYGLDNSWKMTEAERYAGYPVGWALGHEGMALDRVGPLDPVRHKPVFVVTEEFLEYRGRRLTPAMLDRLLALAQ